MRAVSLSTEWFDDAFRGERVIAVFRGADTATAVRLAETAWALGIRNVEIPIESTSAVPSLEAVVRRGAELGHAVGAGTILDETQLQAAQKAGAAYAVSPGLDVRMHEMATRRGMPLLPGVATASEVLRAQQLGYTWMKVFPVATMGHEWFRQMKAPFPALKLVGTGGVTLDNAADLLEAGVDVVGFGAPLADPSQTDRVRALIHSPG